MATQLYVLSKESYQSQKSCHLTDRPCCEKRELEVVTSKFVKQGLYDLQGEKKEISH